MRNQDTFTEDELGGRQPLQKPNELTPSQLDLYDYLQELKISWAVRSHFQSALGDGRLIGPFNVFLYSPEISRAFNGWVDAEAKYASVSPTVRQVIILNVGAGWKAAYELYAHTAVEKMVGLSDQTISSIKAGKAPDDICGRDRSLSLHPRACYRTRGRSRALSECRTHLQ